MADEKKGLLFPGQGVQAPGMDAGLADRHPECRRLADAAAEILGYDPVERIRDAEEGELNPTELAQPLIFLTSAMNLAASEPRDWAVTAGHSLGELTALYAAGVYSFEEGLALVKRRGELMGRLHDESLGMSAVLGLSPEEVDRLVGAEPRVFVANRNTPVQTVITGDKTRMAEMESVFLEAGASSLVPLSVSGAFHSPFMEEVRQEFAREVEGMVFAAPKIPVVSNVTGRVAETPGELRENLIAQVTGQVRWIDTIREMESMGIAGLADAGPGSLFRGMVRRITRTLKVEKLKQNI